MTSQVFDLFIMYGISADLDQLPPGARRYPTSGVTHHTPLTFTVSVKVSSLGIQRRELAQELVGGTQGDGECFYRRGGCMSE